MGIEENVAEKAHEFGFGALLFTFLLSIVAFSIARRVGYFRFPYAYVVRSISLIFPLGAFLLYLGFSYLIFPLLYLFVAYILTGSFQGTSLFTPEFIGYLQFFCILIMVLLLIGYCFMIRTSFCYQIFWGHTQLKRIKIFLRDFGIGMLSWLICYPMMLFISTLVGLISLGIWGERGIEQVAVKNLKQLISYPLLFSLMVFAVVVVVPILEEVLFRGFLQSWLRQYTGRIGAILLGGALFAIVHFSPSQGRGNLELIFSLYVLSCFLGFVYERQTTLWAPIGLHITFNGISVLALCLTS